MHKTKSTNADRGSSAKAPANRDRGRITTEGPTAVDIEFVNRFHRYMYSHGAAWSSTFWMGIRTLKYPSDLLVLQEILDETRPDCVIETGTAYGGSALFVAHIMDLLGSGKVITIDVRARGRRPGHPRITYIIGSSASKITVGQVGSLLCPGCSVMVMLDSDHRASHVLHELELLAPLVTQNMYLIVEDTHLYGHPIEEPSGAGPTEALEEWLPKHPEFQVDRTWEKYLVTQNPGGYLKRVLP